MIQGPFLRYGEGGRYPGVGARCCICAIRAGLMKSASLGALAAGGAAGADVLRHSSSQFDDVDCSVPYEPYDEAFGVGAAFQEGVFEPCQEGVALPWVP